MENLWKMKKAQMMLGVLAAVAVVCAAVFAFIKLRPRDGVVTTVSEASLERVLEISDLSTMNYTYNAVAEVYPEEYKEGDEPKYYVAYEGTVQAGIDMEKISVSVDEKTKAITVILPEAEVQSANVDMGTLEFIFTKKKYETEMVSQEAYKASLSDLEEKANQESELLAMARDNAIDTVNALITPWVKALDAEYTVEVK